MKSPDLNYVIKGTQMSNCWPFQVFGGPKQTTFNFKAKTMLFQLPNTKYWSIEDTLPAFDQNQKFINVFIGSHKYILEEMPVPHSLGMNF